MKMINEIDIPLPKVSLGFFPTPITPLKKLSKLLQGPEIWIKRDDLTGLAFGGNKTRKLEFLLADALKKGCDTVVTGGSEQSNHCRQTAAASVQMGLECHLVLGGDPPKESDGNLFLDQLLGAKIHWAGEFRKGEKMPEVVANLEEQGKKPYLIPYGGSNEVGAFGFVEAFGELQKQMQTQNLSFTHIVFTSSSGGTHAGLIVGKLLWGSDVKIMGIAVDKPTPKENFSQFIWEVASKALSKIDIDKKLPESSIQLVKDYIGEGYGVITEQEVETIQLLARCEGILLDPVYTGKAMGGLIDMVKKDHFCRSDRVLFWHTGGGPSLFCYKNRF